MHITRRITIQLIQSYIHKAKKSKAVQEGDSSCKDSYRKVYFKFSSEPGRRVNLAAAKFNKHLSTVCRPLFPFSLSLNSRESLGCVTHAQVGLQRTHGACVSRSQLNKNIAPPCLDGRTVNQDLKNKLNGSLVPV